MQQLIAEVLLRAEDSPQADLPLASADTSRWVWESKFGPMLIEVRDGDVFLNGELIERALVGSKGNA